MWIMTTLGFASIVEHRDDSSTVVVRTRVRRDAERIRRDLFSHGVGAITSDQGSDYPQRFVATKDALQRALVRSVDLLTYPNFKDAVTAPGDEEALFRHDVYLRVWDDLRELEALNGPRKR